MRLRNLPLLLALCAATPACAALGVVPGAGAATAPSAAIRWGRALSLERPGKLGSLDAVSCAIDATGRQLCVAADETGNVWWSTTPWKRVHAWRRITIDPVKDASLTGISCPTTTFCAAVDDQGYAITSRDPTGGAKGWSRPFHIDSTAAPGGGFAGFAGISCPTASLCVAVDNVGQIFTSTHPTGNAKSWTAASLPRGPVLTSVSCPSTTLCVVAGSRRYYATNPLGGVPAWHAVGAAQGTLESISCASVSACVGVGYGNAATGLASASATPSGSVRAWVNTTVSKPIPTGNGQLLDAVSCPGVAFCVALDGADNVFTSGSPLTGAWVAARAARPHSTSTWSSISCDYKNCVAVDSRGFLTAGTVTGVPRSGASTPTKPTLPTTPTNGTAPTKGTAPAKSTAPTQGAAPTAPTKGSAPTGGAGSAG